MPQKCFQHVLGVGDTSSSKAKLLAFVAGLRASDCLLVTTTLMAARLLQASSQAEPTLWALPAVFPSLVCGNHIY